MNIKTVVYVVIGLGFILGLLYLTGRLPGQEAPSGSLTTNKSMDTMVRGDKPKSNCASCQWY